ncbi:hypothetical protein ABZ935_39370 [Streptomyces coeruleorubidus]
MAKDLQVSVRSVQRWRQAWNSAARYTIPLVAAVQPPVSGSRRAIQIAAPRLTARRRPTPASG